MSKDPYHLWLGITPDEQPPNFYQLLGISVGESDPHVIRHAADRQIASVRNLAPQAPAVALVLIRQLESARFTLLNTGLRAAYDRHLSGDSPTRVVVRAERSAIPLSLVWGFAAGVVAVVAITTGAKFFTAQPAQQATTSVEREAPQAIATRDVAPEPPTVDAVPAPPNSNTSTAANSPTGATATPTPIVPRKFVTQDRALPRGRPTPPTTLANLGGAEGSVLKSIEQCLNAKEILLSGGVSEEAMVTMIAARPDGGMLATANSFGEFSAWSMPNGMLETTGKLSREPFSIAGIYFEDNRLVAHGPERWYEIFLTSPPRYNWSRGRRATFVGAFPGKERQLVIDMGDVQIQDQQGAVLDQWTPDFPYMPTFAAISPNGQRAAMFHDRVVEVRNVEQHEQSLFRHDYRDEVERVVACEFSLDGSRLYVSVRPPLIGRHGQPARLDVWELESGRRVAENTLTGSFFVSWLKPIPDTNPELLLLLGSQGLGVYRASNGESLCVRRGTGRISGSSRYPWRFVAPDDYSWLAVAYGSGTVSVWKK
ncbi:MAG: hypothetical protein KDB14_33660 [Planctomycetales bacterium]|nr:hypothetical protein [Planctomycetales bacterium]